MNASAPARTRPRKVTLALGGAIASACLALGACMVEPPSLRAQFAVRQTPYTPDSGSITIRCGRLIDGVTAAAHYESIVVIRHGRIASIEPDSGRSAAAAALLPVLDLREYTCLPGLIDMHTHLTDRPEDTADLRVYFSRPDEDSLVRAHRHAEATLRAGFTTVRNVGTYVAGTDVLLREAINHGNVAGPRMQVSGAYLTIPKGGGDLYVPGFEEPAENARFHFGVARGPADFQERAEVILSGGVDLLKIIASGAVLAHDGIPGAPEMNLAEIQAVVGVAHRNDRKLAAHAHGADSIRMAIQAGADTIEHASYLDDAGIAAARRRGDVAFAMDVYNGDYIDTEGRRLGWPEEFLRKNRETTEIQRQAFSKAVKARLTIVYATDAGVYPHGLNARQFPIMVERGMRPMAAIQSATSVAARYLGWEQDVGSLEPGKFGDLIAVRGDPLTDIRVLQDVEVVVKGGLIFKLPEPSVTR